MSARDDLYYAAMRLATAACSGASHTKVMKAYAELPMIEFVLETMHKHVVKGFKDHDDVGSSGLG